ncbi:MAG: hypothetical protein EOS65_24005 [Mesorhizobium sp.]|nr:MAG: hypothetical protein EOS65_24005 [Mesorhizobium sp.]
MFRRRLIRPGSRCNQTAIVSFALRGEREEVVLMKLPMLLALGLALAACDNSVQPTKAPVDQNPQVDKNPVPKSTTGGDQQGTQRAQ